jgi:hypothetical protein
MADVDRVAQVELRGQLRDIGGVVSISLPSPSAWSGRGPARSCAMTR